MSDERNKPQENCLTASMQDCMKSLAAKQPSIQSIPITPAITLITNLDNGAVLIEERDGFGMITRVSKLEEQLARYAIVSAVMNRLDMEKRAVAAIDVANEARRLIEQMQLRVSHLSQENQDLTAKNHDLDVLVIAKDLEMEDAMRALKETERDLFRAKEELRKRPPRKK